MEYCGAGSVSDIMRSTFKSSPKNILPLKIFFYRLRKKTLSEEEIATVLCDTLKGLEYLHRRKKIHRWQKGSIDIKELKQYTKHQAIWFSGT